MPGMWKGFCAETLVMLLFRIVRFPFMSGKIYEVLTNVCYCL